MAELSVLAVDIGAESGRTIEIRFDGQNLALQDLHRFPNTPVEVRGTLHWDILRLWSDIREGIQRAQANTKIASLGLDTWAIDFALLGSDNQLLGNPVHYRDRRTAGMMDRVFATVPRAEVFAQTGIQMMPINTLYQLASLAQRQAPALQQATQFLTIPDLLVYWLTGVKTNEYTNATTTQCFNVGTGQWATPLLEQIGIPTKIFGEVLQPGQIVGAYQGTPVVLSAHHDTASAVLGVPARSPNFAYLSSGTWSLLGLERPSPTITDAALAANVTNEGGYGNTIRLLKNVMGLWLLQQSKVTWEAQGQRYDYSQLTDLAAQAEPFAALVDPDDASFLAPGDMPARIRAWCLSHDQPAPESIGAVARCIFESLALKYRHVLSLLTGLTGQSVEAIHIVGGGSQNALLCQMTADATGKVVYAGPTEATALGNALVQLLALREIGSVEEGRALIGESFPLVRYEPQATAVWSAHYERIRPWLG